ncbi:hypothetical protein CBR_g36880 [Chara braunii]|uniref:DUF659 domain-containing protein n=1 Tax=Chara braunii TaxID=69332 RepID=A0A388LM13_CHABU|nr:hypothetical protein CBR_g36880 [Chara braunii]|eukprot:GBG83265.1 hypothetical protein CBR_g36880 [Chara braunii]
MEHFLRKGKPCPYRNGEILHLLALRGGKIEGEAAKKMVHQYRVQKGIAEDTGMEPTGALATGKSDEMEELLRPPPAPGREVRVEGQAAVGAPVEDTQDKIVRPTAGPSFQASTSGSKSTRTTQTSIRKWAENAAQKRLDTQWGRALFRSGVPFNFVRQDETRALHNLYMELGATKAKVDMPMFETVRTAILDLVYDQVKEEVRPVMDKWDISGCTLITDDTTDRRWRPVINFIGAGEGGAVLIKVVDMSHRKTNAAAIAKLWEKVIREIGVHRVNVICTDNAQVYKWAARILSLCKDPYIARIPWVPCAAHTLSLLLKGIEKLPWVATIVKRAKMMVKFIRNHHRTVALFSACSLEETKTLIMPTEVRFTSTYQVLERLCHRDWVLKEMMERGWNNIHWSTRKLRRKAERIFLKPPRSVKGKEKMTMEGEDDEVDEVDKEAYGDVDDDDDDPDYAFYNRGLDEEDEQDRVRGVHNCPPPPPTTGIMDLEAEGASHDDRERAAAKALAQRDWAEVQKRIEEDNAKRLAQQPHEKQQLEEQQRQQHQEDNQYKAEQHRLEPQQEDDGEQQQQGEGVREQQQQEDGRGQQQHVMQQQEHNEEDQQKQQLEDKGHQKQQNQQQQPPQQEPEDILQQPLILHAASCPPPLTHLDESLVHDNLEIRRVGRKWKNDIEPAVDPTVKRGRGRPRKTAVNAATSVLAAPPPPSTRPRRTARATKKRHSRVLEDDPTAAEDNSDREGDDESDPEWS